MPEMIDAHEARATAAALFAAAARRRELDVGDRLSCLQAEQALDVAAVPLPDHFAILAPDELITTALRLLGELPFAEFGTAPVLTAARYGRRALRGRT